ncbi:MAG TPA: sulfatase-like hydrolase/transferase [Thermoanaerobaculia bacterium]|nr:sulfatase-like hydrolase/transferase [Thermoanaerobaculia bacterium]
MLLITLDTVRADRLGSYGGPAGLTPHLDELAAGGVRFAQAMAAAPLTLPSHATILSGVLPPAHGLHLNGFGALPADTPTLATRLSAAGYRTAAFVASFVLDRRFGLARGFEVYDDQVDRSDERRAALEAERPGREVVNRALAWLGQDEARPFFAWVHLYDAHAPYAPPEPFAARWAGRPYEGEVAAVDHEVGRLLTHLEREKLAQRTLVVVAADHGEGLGEHGELTHGLLLYEPTVRVPWLMRAPGLLPEGSTVSTPVGLADLAPTVLGLLQVEGVAGPAEGLGGSDLSAALRADRAPEAEEEYAESRYPASFGWSPLAVLRRGSLKYISAPQPELYDLGRDPAESENRAAALPDAASALAGGLERIGLAELGRPAAAPDAETRARLAALGYVSAPAPAAGGRAGEPLRRDPKEVVHLFRAYEGAQRAMSEGRFDLAQPELERILAQDPGNAVFRVALAKAVRARGDLPRAIALYRQATEAAPADPDAWYSLASALEEAGQGEAALAALERTLGLDPSRPEAWNAAGVAHAGAGRLAEAKSRFERAVELDPGNARGWNNLGNVARDLGLTAEAEGAYRRAIEIAPRYADPLNGLGTLEAARDRPREALALFEQALILDPQLHEVRLNRAISLELAGHRAAAIAGYRDFLVRSRGDPHFVRQRQVAEQLLARLAGAG